MNLSQLMDKVDNYNEIAEIFGNKKCYVRFDGFHRFHNKEEALNQIKRNYLNRTQILEVELLERPDAGCYYLIDDGFTYEVLLFLHYWKEERK